MKLKKHILLLISALFICSGLMPLYAQDDTANTAEDTEEITFNYCYAGPVISAGYMKATYTDWFDDSTQQKSFAGMSYSGGAVIAVYADYFCGDFTIKYVYNQLDYTLCYTEFAVTGKMLFSVGSMVDLGGGLGFYFETPPANMDYNGSSGITIPFTTVINITRNETKLFFDIYFGYGSFGIGEDTSSISAGINAGLIFKVGSI